jgi:hypothetical protein
MKYLRTCWLKAGSFEQAIGTAIYHTSTGVDVLGHARLRMSGLVRGGQRGESCVKHQGRYCFRRTCDVMPSKPAGAKARLNCFCVLMESHSVPVDVGKTGDVLFCDRRCISISWAIHLSGPTRGR